MPIYEYTCSMCGVAHEISQKMSDQPVKICPSCGCEGLVRKISGSVAIQFTGNGFYTTDYAKTSKKSSCCGKCSDGCSHK